MVNWQVVGLLIKPGHISKCPKLSYWDINFELTEDKWVPEAIYSPCCKEGKVSQIYEIKLAASANSDIMYFILVCMLKVYIIRL